MKEFLENVVDPSHQFQRMRMNMLRYDMRIVHRPSYMMKDVDILTRYNRKGDEIINQISHPDILHRYCERALILKSLSEKDNDKYIKIKKTTVTLFTHKYIINPPPQPIEFTIDNPKVIGS